MPESTKDPATPEPIITPEQIMEEAQRIIDAAPDFGPYQPQRYARALPSSASELAGLLSSPEMVELAKQYHWADKRSMRAQTWNNLLTKTAALTGFGAGMLVGVYLFLGIRISPFPPGLGAIPFYLLAIALLSLLAAVLFKPLRIWKVRRLEAEELRLAIFDRIVGPSDKPRDGLSLALQLECFRRHLFEDQMAYFSRRSKDKQREARFWKRLGWLAGGLTVLGSSVPQAMALIDTLAGQQGVLIDILRGLTSLLPQDRTLYTSSWFIGFNLTALATLIPMIYKSWELAKTYRREYRFLKRCERQLPSARAAAAAGHWTSMITFPQIVSSMLLEGVQEWASRDEMLD
jgi:hypothetical protein